MIPAPNLLAEPSRPSARYGRSGRYTSELETLFVREFQDVVPGLFSGNLLSGPGIVESGARRRLFGQACFRPLPH